MVKRIGLTGGIGSGKSTVGMMLVELGAHLVDTDAISKSLTAARGLALPRIVQAFGADMVDANGALNRDRMRAIVFDDARALDQLQAILHPLIGEQAHAQAALAAPGQRVVFDVPLLVETWPRWRPVVDRIVVVDCLPQTQVRRVMARSGWSQAMVERVMAQQSSREQRLQVADHVLHNDGETIDELRLQVQQLWQLWNNAQ